MGKGPLTCIVKQREDGAYILQFLDPIMKGIDISILDPKVANSEITGNIHETPELLTKTGLKDKNGVEIYEGKNSIKLVIKGCGEGYADIIMHEGKWCVFEQSQGFASLFDLLNGNSTEIYSNPELLK